jgi:oxalate decarboxylase/phosphoglucose isomerase-like protein (cupin superfamily)
MKPVLMSPAETGPEIHYYMIRGGSDKTNVTVWESGTVGTEYIKSFGHYHIGDLEETYTVLEGEGVVILQERELDADGKPIDDRIRSFRAIRVTAGQSVHIPKNTGHLAINTGSRWFVTSDDSPVDFSDANPVSLPGHADYEPFRKLRGAAYYVVRETGTGNDVLKLVKNSLYTKVPPAVIEQLS